MAAAPSATTAAVAASGSSFTKDVMWHAVESVDEVFRLAGTSARGLGEAEAKARATLYGANSLTPAARAGPLKRLFDQIHNILIYVLLISGSISMGFKHYVDGGVIYGVVVVNVLIGFFMEGRAENATDALRKLMSPQTTVLRGGERHTIDAKELTLGDVVLLQAGDSVPADVRLINTTGLQVQEAMLTGESHAVTKNTIPVPGHSVLADRTDLAYSGTLVMAGTGRGVVIAIGDACEIGKISKLVGSVEATKTPLLVQLDIFGRYLSLVVLCVGALAFGVAVARDNSYADSFAYAVGLAVAAIPEGLPSVIVITLSVGVERMSQQKAIIRQLPAVETLGALNVICSDKTGTLTKNEMTAVAFITARGIYRISGVGYTPVGTIKFHEDLVSPRDRRRLLRLVLPGLLCNDSSLRTANAPEPSSDKLVTAPAAEPRDTPKPEEDLLPTTITIPSGKQKSDVMPGQMIRAPHRHLSEAGLERVPSMRMAEAGAADTIQMARSQSISELFAAPTISMVSVSGDSRWTMTGDPTEVAILAFGMKIGVADLNEVTHLAPRVGEIPFDSDHKFMATLHALPTASATGSKSSRVLHSLVDLATVLPFSAAAAATAAASSEGGAAAAGAVAQGAASSSSGSRRLLLCVKGAPEKLILRCADELVEEDPGHRQPIRREWWAQQALRLAEEGLRVLALAWMVVPDTPGVEESLGVSTVMVGEPALTLVGLVGIVDPPRDEAVRAVSIAKTAGIEVKMITGDHPKTAAVIASQIGINNSHVMTGVDLDQVDDEQLFQCVRQVSVYARATPEHKLRIVRALQRHRYVVAMTGDGVNDAPALKQASVGVAMGITGTEVSKEAAKMVLADDNFATIVEAVRTGRGVYDNLIKTILFVLPTNGGQAFSILFGLILGIDVPITAVQILWVNLITSVTLGLVFAFESAEETVMERPPRRAEKRIFGKLLMWRIFFVSTILVVSVLGNFAWEQATGSDLETSRTVAVNTLCIAQVAYLFNVRFLRETSFNRSVFANNSMVFVGIFAIAAFQALFTYSPGFTDLFKTRSIDGVRWLRILMFSAIVFLLVEFDKKVGVFILRNFVLPTLRRCGYCMPRAEAEPAPALSSIALPIGAAAAPPAPPAFLDHDVTTIVEEEGEMDDDDDDAPATSARDVRVTAATATGGEQAV